MNKQTGIVIGVVVVLLLIGGVYASMSVKNDMAKDAMMPEEEKMMQEESMQDGEVMQKEGDDMMKDENMSAGTYEAYSADKIARAETGDVVLFFHAAWCPSCRSLNSNIEANMSGIPEGVSILKLDYDTETSLKQKYGVTTQHTLVQVDKDGNLIKKWSGSPSLTSLVAQIQ